MARGVDWLVGIDGLAGWLDGLLGWLVENPLTVTQIIDERRWNFRKNSNYAWKVLKLETNSNYKWEVFKFMKKGSDYRWDVLKFGKIDNYRWDVVIFAKMSVHFTS